ncbi:MAG: 1-(5-phosphoribosyl)-5-[(5-phosphoribosylamino)methylideneamino]imidazole-4-carboxamide isomerase [Proteobacteria bacterium]|nr:1-(5-phosphoribosyl)-5-[(5-phosphoribosylamino)methylideneamino]imidazole-4-carboxamide isomerase [Pseudomonadota bacterium]
MILYPAIDLLDGACVRLSQGDFAKKTVYDADPAVVLARFAGSGVNAVHIVDLNGAKDPTARQTQILETLLRSRKMKAQVGGGVRSVGDVAELLAAGAERVVVGTVAAERPKLFHEMLAEFGGGRLTLAVDVHVGPDGPRVASRGWSKASDLDAAELIGLFRSKGLTRVLCTDISKDGMMKGPNVSLYESLLREFPDLELQASGGVRSVEDLLALKKAKLHSAVIGKAIYEGKLDLAEAVKRC